jgi:hypothetical protein
VPNFALAAGNLLRAAWNRTAKQWRQLRQRARRGSKSVREAGKDARARARGAVAAGRDARAHAYSGTVKATRYWNRMQSRLVPKVRRELAVRGGLRAAARSGRPIVAGPFLSEVGYEVLYWVPFLRWFADHYGVSPDRMVAVSRGGASGWYAGVADRYVELLDLYPPDAFAARNAERQRHGEQKQHGLASFDEEILARVRAQPGLADAVVCHPSAMFRLLRQFWLGNESLEYLLDHLRYAAVVPPPIDVPGLPEHYTAMKFYTGMALPDSDANRRALRGIVEQAAALGPVVLLDTRLQLDEHTDYLFDGIAGVTSLAGRMTPATNLAVQTEVIRRADRFVGTCGSLAWLAPMLGTETLAIYEDDHLLTSHLYAARHAYGSMGAAPFTALDLHAVRLLGGERLPRVLAQRTPA